MATSSEFAAILRDGASRLLRMRSRGAIERRCYNTLLRLNSRPFDDRAVALDAVLEQRAELLRAAADDGKAVLIKHGTRVGRVEPLHHLRVEPGGDGRRQAGWAEEAEP